MLGRTYRITGRSAAAAIFRRGETLTVNYVQDGANSLIQFSTRYAVGPSDVHIPLDMMAIIETEASSVDDAARQLTAGREIANVIALCVNAAIAPLKAEVVYETTPQQNERQFFQRFVERDNITLSSRTIPKDETVAFIGAVAAHQDRNRILRAIAHYCQALMDWEMGSELPALSHLWMGVEALGAACLRQALSSKSKEALAAEWGWSASGKLSIDAFLQLNARIRLVMLDDYANYKIAKDVSDKFEHGLANAGELFKPARDALLPVANALRTAIIGIAAIPKEQSAVLLGPSFAKQKGPGGLEQYIRGTLVGQGDVLAEQGYEYPFLDWNHTIKSVEFDEATHTFGYKPEHNFTPHIAPGIQFTNIKVEIWDGGFFQPAPAATIEHEGAAGSE